MEKKTVALIASLDTKLRETMYAKEELERCGCRGIVIDASTKKVMDAGAQIGPKEILRR
jgi:uncharacterized protein (UPF0261 family)